MVLRHPKMFASVMLTDLVSTVDYLRKDLGMTEKELKRLIKVHPRVVRYNRGAVKRNVSFFRTRVLGGVKEGKQKKGLKKIYMSTPRLLGYSVPGLLSKILYFKETVGLNDDEVRELVLGMPSILTYKEGNIGETLKWMEEIGVGGEKIKRCLVKYPNLFTLSVKSNMIPKVEWMESRLGLDRDRGHITRVVTMFPPIMWLSRKNLEDKVGYLQDTFGWDERDVRKMVLNMPQVLGLALEGNIKLTVEYYLEQGCDVGMMGEVFLENPSLLMYSLEGRIKPRVREMEEKGILVKYAPLYLVGRPEKTWKRWIETQGGTWSVNE